MDPISGGGGGNGRFIRGANAAVEQGFGKLSTGKRILVSGDDAAGLAIARKLDAREVSISQAARNAYDAQSLLATAESGLGGAQDIIHRLRELATQAANPSTGDTGRSAIQQEVAGLQQELVRIESTTEWNGRALFSDAERNVTVQAGADADDAFDVDLGGAFVSPTGLDGIDLSTAASAADALGQLDAALEGLSARRAGIGAAYNRLGVAAEGLVAAREPLAAARSRIEDADFAQAASESASARIREQAAVAVAAHGNLSANLVGRLLGLPG